MCWVTIIPHYTPARSHRFQRHLMSNFFRLCSEFVWFVLFLSASVCKRRTSLVGTQLRCPCEILKCSTVSFLPGDRCRTMEHKSKDERGRTAPYRWVGTQWIRGNLQWMTGWPSSISLCLSFFLPLHILLCSSMLRSLCDTMSLLWGTCFWKKTATAVLPWAS